MAEIRVPVVIDGYECVEDMAQAVLAYTYKGRTLKEWADSISDPKTNYDRLISTTPEEMAEWFADYGECPPERGYPDCAKTPTDSNCRDCWLDWLNSPAEERAT